MYTVVFASDGRGWMPLTVAVYSLCEKAAETTTYDIRILCDKVSDEQKDTLCHCVESAPTHHPGRRKHQVSFIQVGELVENDALSRGAIPQMGWARIFIPQLMPEVNKAVYIDNDTVIATDLTPLFEIPMEDKAIGAVLEQCCAPTSDFNERLNMPLDCAGYFNSGVLLLNLDFFRTHNLTQKLIAFSKSHEEGLRSQDQDALNGVLHPYFIRLHPRWNWHDGLLRRILKGNPNEKLWRAHSPREYVEAALHPGIFHFVGPNKPWKYNHRPYRKVFEDCLLRSGLSKKIRTPGWNLRDFIKRIAYIPLYALTWRRVHRLARYWGIK